LHNDFHLHLFPGFQTKIRARLICDDIKGLFILFFPTMEKKRKANDLPSSQPKRQQLVIDYGAILYSILERLHKTSPNLIQFFKRFTYVNKAFYKVLSKLSTKTTQQHKIAKMLLKPHPIDREMMFPPPPELYRPLYESGIEDINRLATGPGTGKTRLMLEACAIILREKNQSVVIISSESFFPMYQKLLEDITKTNGWKEVPRLSRFDRKRPPGAKYRAIICMSPRNYTSIFARYAKMSDLHYIFSDDYAGSNYPRFVHHLCYYLFDGGAEDYDLNYLSITASQTNAELNQQSDPQLSLAPTTVDFHVVTRCSQCPDHCLLDGEWLMFKWTLEALPYPFDDLVTKVFMEETKVVLFMQFTRFNNFQHHRIKNLLLWATKKKYIDELFWSVDCKPKDLGLNIAAFNSAKRGLLVLDTRTSVIRGHSIYASTLVYLNTVSFHSNTNCAREFELFDQPPSLDSKDLDQLIGRIRRPDTPFSNLRVIIYDAAVSLVIPLVLSASGKFKANEIHKFHQKFISKNKVDSYRAPEWGYEKQVREEKYRLEERIDEHDPFSKQNVRNPNLLTQARHPKLQDWKTRLKALDATKMLVQRVGFPEYLCQKVRPYLLNQMDFPHFEQVDLTHFRIQFS
jgi:hypothetical protein